MANGDDAAAAGMDVVPSTAQLKMGYDEINKSRDYIAQRTSAVTPVAKGGTGATTAAAARTNLGVTSANVPSSGGSNVQADLDFLGATKSPVGHTHNAGDIHPGTFATGGPFTFPEQLWATTIMVPSATPATSGYTIAYINGDGRLSKGASSARYKKYVRDAAPLSVAATRLREFQMKGGDGRWILGHIAEEFADDADLERFVVYDADGRPEAIDYIQFLLAAVAGLGGGYAHG